MTAESVGPPGLLDGKVVIVTGASQGIGQVAGNEFPKVGASVVLAARREALVKEHADQIVKSGGAAIGVATDVADEASVQALVDATIDRFGRIDGVFNNAGVDQMPPALLHEVPLSEWRRVHEAKVDGTFLVIKHVVPHMMDRGGSIVNNGSVVSERAFARYPSPSSSQAAVLGITRSAATAYGSARIRVNAIATGGVLTSERAKLVAEHRDEAEAHRPAAAAMCPLGRLAHPLEIAAVAAWLLSDWSSYVTGAVVAADGGALAGGVLT